MSHGNRFPVTNSATVLDLSPVLDVVLSPSCNARRSSMNYAAVEDVCWLIRCALSAVEWWYILVHSLVGKEIRWQW
jgi:hypothetical protein